MKIYRSVKELIGRTPLLELANYEAAHGLEATLLAKLECMNPAGSAKDRVAAHMILRAEEAGLLPPGGTINKTTDEFYDNLERIKALQKEHDADLLFGHDQEQILEWVAKGWVD